MRILSIHGPTELRLEPALTHTLQPHPFSGFYLEVACKLDAACPGYLNRVLHASRLSRQAQFAAYAALDFDHPDDLAERLRDLAPALCDPHLDPVAQVARALMGLRARQIARGVYGSLPDGFLGLLARLGSEPLCYPADYKLAFDGRALCARASRVRADRLRPTRRTDAQGRLRNACSRTSSAEPMGTSVRIPSGSRGSSPAQASSGIGMPSIRFVILSEMRCERPPYRWRRLLL